MSYSDLRHYLKSRGYYNITCKQCSLSAWTLSPEHEYCGSRICYPYVRQENYKDSSWTSAKLIGQFKEYFSGVRCGVDCIPLRRASAIIKYSEINFMFAGICAFQKLLQKDCDEDTMNHYAGKLFHQNQFCFRFEDLKHVGSISQHNSGFIMSGLHLFEGPKFKFSSNWEAQWFDTLLTFVQGLGLNPRGLSFIQDIWIGAGRRGSCIQLFYEGIEIGNMVFIDRDELTGEPLPHRILDVGMGFERLLYALGGTVEYISDPVKDHLRSLLVGVKDGALCSKIGVGYSMRKILQQCYVRSGNSTMSELTNELRDVARDLEEIFGEPFTESIPKLLQMSLMEEERLNG